MHRLIFIFQITLLLSNSSLFASSEALENFTVTPAEIRNAIRALETREEHSFLSIPTNNPTRVFHATLINKLKTEGTTFFRIGFVLSTRSSSNPNGEFFPKTYFESERWNSESPTVKKYSLGEYRYSILPSSRKVILRFPAFNEEGKQELEVYFTYESGVWVVYHRESLEDTSLSESKNGDESSSSEEEDED